MGKPKRKWFCKWFLLLRRKVRGGAEFPEECNLQKPGFGEIGRKKEADRLKFHDEAPKFRRDPH